MDFESVAVIGSGYTPEPAAAFIIAVPTLAVDRPLLIDTRRVWR